MSKRILLPDFDTLMKKEEKNGQQMA